MMWRAMMNDVIHHDATLDTRRVVLNDVGHAACGAE
jgi:hypothetical protein